MTALSRAASPTTVAAPSPSPHRELGGKSVLALVLTAALLPLAVPSLAQKPAEPVDSRWGPTDPGDPRLNQGPKAEAIATGGMVSTQLASSTLAALEVLEAGGNAADAAVAALFVQQVHDYHMVFLFGSMSALYYDAASDRVYALDAIAERPSAWGEGTGDASRVAIGGTVRGAAALHRRFGSRPWASLVEPAVEAAEEGAIVTSFMYGLNFALFEVGLLGDLRDNVEARAFYMPEGHLVGVGQRWKMPALAATLRRVAEDPDWMYTGGWAERFVAAAREAGGKVSMADLAAYQPRWTDPVTFSYRGHTLHGSPPPDTGGLEVGTNLNVLEHFDLAKLGRHWESIEALEVMARTMARVEREIGAAVRDPLTWKIPSEVLLSEDYGRLGAEWVRQSGPRGSLAPPADASPEPATGGAGPRADLGSDHLVIVDRFGNWLTMLHTIHGGAPGVFVDGVRATGSEFGSLTAVGPGRRLVLPITAILIEQDDRPWLAMGTPGNPPQPVTEVLVNILDHGMDPKQAADAPRFWAFRQGDGPNPDTIQIEGRLAEGLEAAAKARGLAFDPLGDYNFHTGSMQIVWRDAEGRLHGVTDARRLGFAAGHD